MKFFACCILAISITTFCSAQKRCNLKIVTDKLANFKTAFTPAVNFTNGVNNMNLNFWRTGEMIVFSAMISGTDLFCIDNASSVVIQFTDHTSTTLNASNTGNCTGSLQSYLRQSTSAPEFELLSTKTINLIDIKGKDVEAVFKTGANEARQLKNYFICLKEASL